MVHCRVASPYPSPTYQAEGDYLSISNGYFNAPGGYTRGMRDINKFGIWKTSIGKPDDEIARYRKDKSRVQVHMVQSVQVRREL
jgi:hypothetical protein